MKRWLLAMLLLAGMAYEMIMPHRWLRNVWGGRWKRNPRER